MMFPAADALARSRCPVGILAVSAAALLTSAHVGDNNTHFRGAAGPYTVQVVVRHPGVVPGLAQITVRVEQAGVRAVSVRPVRWDVGLAGSPRPDPATAVPGDPELFAAELWFMTPGSYSVYVDVEGDAGSGTAVVPVTSLATRQIGMNRGLGVLLVLLGLLLTAGLVTIVRAAVREAVLPPGMPPTAARRRRTRWATAASLVLIVLILTGGRLWWRSEENAYRGTLHEPIAVTTELRHDADRAELRLTLVDPRWLAKQWSPLVPDHGKLMHAFLVRAPRLDVFAHVHPQPVHADSFSLLLPPLPTGEYRLYADVVHESGFAQTLTDTISLPAVALPDSTAPQPDPDDTWWTGSPPAAPATGRGTLAVLFEDGSSIAWVRDAAPIIAGRSLELRFAARQADGSAAPLEPYMGMFAHAVVARRDGAVFVHLHPSGSISMAAQDVLLRAEPVNARIGSPEAPPGIVVAALPDNATTPGSAAAEAHEQHVPPAPAMVPPLSDASSEVVIPYAFPSSGDYRLWVQVKQQGVIRTAAFDVRVVDGRPSSR